MSGWQESHHEVHRVSLHVPSILQNFSVFGQHLERCGSSSLSHLYSVAGPLVSNFSGSFLGTVIKVINGEVLFVLHPLTQLIKLIRSSQPHDCLEDVLKLQVKFLLGFEEGVRDGFTHWCFGNVGRGCSC